MDKIFLQGVQVNTVIGVYDWERTAPQTLELDMEIGLSGQHASQSDRLEDTLDYALIVERIRAYLQTADFQLLEALAEAVAQLILKEFHAPWVRIAVTKFGVLDKVARVGISLERKNTHANG